MRRRVKNELPHFYFFFFILCCASWSTWQLSQDGSRTDRRCTGCERTSSLSACVTLRTAGFGNVVAQESDVKVIAPREQLLASTSTLGEASLSSAALKSINSTQSRSFPLCFPCIRPTRRSFTFPNISLPWAISSSAAPTHAHTQAQPPPSIDSLLASICNPPSVCVCVWLCGLAYERSTLLSGLAVTIWGCVSAWVNWVQGSHAWEQTTAVCRLSVLLCHCSGTARVTVHILNVNQALHNGSFARHLKRAAGAETPFIFHSNS